MSPAGSGPMPGGNVDIHNHVGNLRNSTRSEFGVFPRFTVTHGAREFHNPVMYFHTDGAGDDTLFPIQFSEDIVLNLHVIFHGAVPS
jgi:hypothetical protein